MKEFLIGVITFPLWIVFFIIAFPIWILYNIGEAFVGMMKDMGEITLEIKEGIKGMRKK